jgi:hypothetical protein
VHIGLLSGLTFTSPLALAEDKPGEDNRLEELPDKKFHNSGFTVWQATWLIFSVQWKIRLQDVLPRGNQLS